MTSSYPTSLDSFTNPGGTDNLSTSVGGRTHSAMHADINDAVENIQAELGTDPSGVFSTVKARLDQADHAVANVQTADYTAVLSDAGKVVELNKATAIALTIPPASSVAWVAGTVIGVYQAGVGNATITAGAGVTIRNNAALRGQYAEASLRYRGSDEWVLEGDLATASAPALKDYAEVALTSGNITFNTTSLTAVNTALDLTISAAAGDLVEYGISGVTDTGSGTFCLEVFTMPSGSPVNPFGAGLVSALSNNKQGISGWETLQTGVNVNLTGGMTRVLVSGDVASGATVLRLYVAKIAATARVLYANADIPLKVWAKNYGQV